LLYEGIAREFVNRVQNLRKQSNFEIIDRITIKYNTNENFKAALEIKKEFIMNEVLGEQMDYVDFNEKMTEFEINDEKIFVLLSKV